MKTHRLSGRSFKAYAVPIIVVAFLLSPHQADLSSDQERTQKIEVLRTHYSGRILVALNSVGPEFKPEFASSESGFWKRYEGVLEPVGESQNVDGYSLRDSVSRRGLISSSMNLYLAEVKNGTPEEVVETLSADPDVRYAEQEIVYPLVPIEAPYQPSLISQTQEYIVSSFSRPNDPDFAKQNLEAMGVFNAWNRFGTSTDTIIALLDSRIDTSSPDFAGNIHPASWNVVEDSSDIAFRTNHHATDVGSMAVAVGNNGYGIAGICWRAQLLALVCLREDGSNAGHGGIFISDAIKAIDRAISVKRESGKPMVMIMAWGGPNGQSELFKQKLTAAGKEGILMVCAAGNNAGNLDQRPEYPANYAQVIPQIVPVAASADYLNNALVSYSNFGEDTVPVSVTATNLWGLIPGGTGPAGGTSAASGIVGGFAALAFNQFSSWLEVKNFLLGTTQRLSSLQGKVSAGLIDMRGQWNGNISPVITAPDHLEATAGQPISLQFSASDPEGNPLRCILDFGDDTAYVSIQGVGQELSSASQHPYTQPGTYQATLYVFDGVLTASKVISVTVSAPVELLQLQGNVKVKKNGKKVSFFVTSSKQAESPRPVLTVSELGRQMEFDLDTQAYWVRLKRPPHTFTVVSSAGGRLIVSW